eukprot:symbB.v1.2.021568.t1/scaffold1869.1/size97865/2
MTTESFRKDVAKKLSELQASSDEDAKIDFPTDLTSSDRKYIHKIAESFRLHTLSSGTGDARFISVYKNPPAGQEAKRPREPAGATPQLSLSAAAAQSLQQIVFKLMVLQLSAFLGSAWGGALVMAQLPTRQGDLAKECLIKGLQAHISFLQELLTGDGCQAEMLAEERRRSSELMQLLEKKSSMCEDLAAQKQRLEANLLLKEKELATAKEKRCTWDDTSTAPPSSGAISARSSVTDEEEDVIEAFVASLAAPSPAAPSPAVPLERQKRRQQERCRTLSREVSQLSAALRKLGRGRPILPY